MGDIYTYEVLYMLYYNLEGQSKTDFEKTTFKTKQLLLSDEKKKTVCGYLKMLIEKKNPDASNVEVELINLTLKEINDVKIDELLRDEDKVSELRIKQNLEEISID